MLYTASPTSYKGDLLLEWYTARVAQGPALTFPLRFNSRAEGPTLL